MKKWMKAIALVMLFPLVGCNQEGKPLNQKLLDDISGDNITYRTDYEIYYYENDKPENETLIEHYDVIAKFTPEHYQMVSYSYGTDTVVSSANYASDEEGYVANTDVNMFNELDTRRVRDGEGKTFLWTESVYYNSFGKLKANDFAYAKDKKAYIYQGDLQGLPLNIIHAMVPTSNYDLGEVAVFVKNSAISKVVFQEIEGDDVYVGHMYGRRLTLTFEDIGSTVINDVKAYPVSPDNDDLGVALTQIKSLSSYQIQMDAIKDNEVSLRYRTTITPTDALVENYTGKEPYYGGYHTHEGVLYSFKTVSGYLYGKTYPLDNFRSSLPSFRFSKDVFAFEGEDNEGYKVYRAYPSMARVLDDVDFEMEHTGDYSSNDGSIRFFVKDQSLAKIEFPGFIFADQAAIKVTYRLSYKDLGNASIDTSVWDNFVTELPSGDAGWNTKNMTFEFAFSDQEGDAITVTLEDVFKACLGEDYNIPYFLPSNHLYMDVSGNKSLEDQCVYINFLTVDVLSSSEMEQVISVLEPAGFEAMGEEGFYEFMKGDIYIGVMMDASMGTNFDIMLPLGNIDSLKSN